MSPRPNEFVWWLDPPSASGTEPYEFGHKVEISVPTSGDAVARVTFFSSMAFGIRFGHVTHEKSETVTTHIDPLAPHPPNDVHEHRSNSSDIGLERPVSQAETLKKATTTGTAQKAFESFMRRVTDYRLREDMRPLLDRLHKAKTIGRSEQTAEVNRIVDENRQRVLNLIQHVANDFPRNDNAASKFVTMYLDAMFPRDREPSSTFRSASDFLQEEARRSLATVIDNELGSGSLDLDRLSMLLGGGAGAEIVGRTVLSALTEIP